MKTDRQHDEWRLSPPIEELLLSMKNIQLWRGQQNGMETMEKYSVGKHSYTCSVFMITGALNQVKVKRQMSFSTMQCDNVLV